MSQIILTAEQKAMLLRLFSNYQALLGDSSALTSHQVAYLLYALTTIPIIVQVGPGDQLQIAQLRAQIQRYYQPDGS